MAITTRTPAERRKLVDTLKRLRGDLLRMQRALENDDKLSDYAATGHMTSARWYWKSLAAAYSNDSL